MFRKILIANRGVIACRIMRTLDRMGIASVAVYSEADRHSLHVMAAGEAVCVGAAPAARSYLSVDRILAAAKASGAEAIHPGYGFLSENADFAEACAAEGIAFIGPRPEHLRAFGLKHTAREIAERAGVPLAPGSGLLGSLGEAEAAAERIGYPVMIKSTGGGGGIGLSLCRSRHELAPLFERVTRLAAGNFRDSSVYLEKFVERGRHIEVQIFGDGAGRVLALGERDCSAQRRNQKVIEETPAPNLPETVRTALSETAQTLGAAVNYASAGTVEYLYDVDAEAFYFLEVNTRLQVEHGVTEEIFGIDLVEWMLRHAAGEALPLDEAPEPRGHAMQARIYAEDPAKNFRPSAGLLTRASFPPEVRVETCVADGSEVPAFYDPMIAKIIAVGETREDARKALRNALAATELGGIETNRDYLGFVLDRPEFLAGIATTRLLEEIDWHPATIEVLSPGTQTTVLDFPGRLGFWDVGVPPSGPMDSLSFRLANRAVGNAAGEAALEITLSGPTLRFSRAATICLAGAPMLATLDRVPVPYWLPVEVPAGATLAIGSPEVGARAYLAVRGGFDVPAYLGSRATFTLGKFGGHAGRALLAGDVLHVGGAAPVGEPAPVPQELVPEIGRAWTIGVLYGPHGAPDFFTPEGIETFFAAAWEVHYNSSRTGVRLIGPKPAWARADGGEAGLHPSNIHDNAYAVGAVDFTGDMPIILGPDGPSLGGFVCPVTIAVAELWKIGQLQPGDRVSFVPISDEAADTLRRAQEEGIAFFAASVPGDDDEAGLPPSPSWGGWPGAAGDGSGGENPSRRRTVTPPVSLFACGSERSTLPIEGRERWSFSDRLGSPILAKLPATGERPRVLYRRSGDDNILVEYGPLVLDIALRMRVQALLEKLATPRPDWAIDLTPGIRSLQVHFDPDRIAAGKLLDLLQRLEQELPPPDAMAMPSRIVHMPLSWDDAATRLAIEKYMQSVRPDAPWCPSNIEFIRRINGLDDVAAVKRIVFEADWLVLGLGDVYLGAPVATPLDPRHRLVTTKYNPARTWTPENAVGIGGAYLCVYGMEGPGGYQFVGRTCQVWNTFRATPEFEPGKPWLLRFFDRIRFYEVGHEELLAFRDGFLHGQARLDIEPGVFRLADYRSFLADNAQDIAAFEGRRQAAFEAERERWAATGQLDFAEPAEALAAAEEGDLPPGSVPVTSPVPGSVWKIEVSPGTAVKAGEPLFVIESMKMEIAVPAPADGTLAEIRCAEGRAVALGQVLAVIEPPRSSA